MLNRCIACCLVLGLVPTVSAKVLINEVFYHAPDDLDRLEWVELLNAGEKDVDVSGWKLASGVEYVVPRGTTIGSGGFLVICKDIGVFREYYADVPAVGGYEQSLSDGGETLRLLDPSNKVVDELSYDDRAPWPVAPDGYGASLERIVPTGPSHVENWSSSTLPKLSDTPAGTPGRRNDRFVESPLPQVRALRVTPKAPAPNAAITVTCQPEARAGVKTVEVLYQTVQGGKLSDEQVVRATKKSDDLYQGVVPGQPAGVLVRVRVRVTDGDGRAGFSPSPHDLRPAVSLYVMDQFESATIPLAFMIHTDPDIAEQAKQALQSSRGWMPSRMLRTQANVSFDMAMDFGTAWDRIMRADKLPAETQLALRELFAKQLSRRDEIVDQLLSKGDSRSALQELGGQVNEVKQDFETALKGLVPDAVFAKYRSSATSLLRGPAQFLGQMIPIERLWLTIETEFECSDQQREQLAAAVAKVQTNRMRLVPTLLKIQTGMGRFEDLQAHLGKVESGMWDALVPILSLRQERFARRWFAGNSFSMGGGAGGMRVVPPPRGSSAFVHVDSGTGDVEVFDFVVISRRSAGFKVRFHKDRLFGGMSTANVIYEVNERFVIAEPLAFELYRQVGSPASLTDFVRLQVDDQLAGYYLLFEQPNRAFLRRNGRDDNGNLYKLIWYGNGVEGKYEKKTNFDNGHDDLLQVLKELEETSGQPQWEVIQKRFNVDQLINYFAVNMCLSHWDGFFNNFFAYHDVEGTGKWEMYPWDQDKTSGFHDRTGENEVFTDMPLTYGMEGDVPPGGGKPRMFALGWWRFGGEFSRPLLANSQFRQRYLQRLKTILTDIYSEEHFFPVIDAMADRLRPEVTVRANARGENPDDALQRFERNIGLLREHLVKRRAFLLEQDELKNLDAAN